MTSTLRVNKAQLHKATVLGDQFDSDCDSRFGTKMVRDKEVKGPDCFTISSPALVPRYWSCSKIPQTLSRLYCKICTGEEWHIGIVGITHRPKWYFYLDITVIMVIRIIFLPCMQFKVLWAFLEYLACFLNRRNFGNGWIILGFEFGMSLGWTLESRCDPHASMGCVQLTEHILAILGE